MPKMLNDGAIEYEDGTPATEAQVNYYCHCLSLQFLDVGLGLKLDHSHISVTDG